MNEGMIDNNNKEGKKISVKNGKDEKPINPLYFLLGFL